MTSRRRRLGPTTTRQRPCALASPRWGQRGRRYGTAPAIFGCGARRVRAAVAACVPCRHSGTASFAQAVSWPRSRAASSSTSSGSNSIYGSPGSGGILEMGIDRCANVPGSEPRPARISGRKPRTAVARSSGHRSATPASPSHTRSSERGGCLRRWRQPSSQTRRRPRRTTVSGCTRRSAEQHGGGESVDEDRARGELFDKLEQRRFAGAGFGAPRVQVRCRRPNRYPR
jgi:hypothetical protein